MSIEEKLTMIAENEPKVYDAGYKAGADALHKAFCDIFQNGGKRTNYSRAFYGEGWTDKTFKPTYNMQPVNAYYMFACSCINANLAKLLRTLGVTLDLSKASNIETCFAETDFQRVGIIDTTSAETLTKLFLNSKRLIEINKLILKEDGSQTFTRAFKGLTALTTINVSGAIGGSTFDISDATKLSKASIVSIINAVSTTQNVKITLPWWAVIQAFGSTSNAEWLALINTRPKCTVSLA